MKESDRSMKEILSQDIQVSDMVNERLECTYEMLTKRQGNSGKTVSYRKKLRVAVAAAAIICCGIPSVVYASVKSGFFEGVFGNETRHSTDAIQKEIDEGKEEKAQVTIPSREYVAVDEERASELLGKWVMDIPIVNQVGSHTLSVDNFLYDKNGALMSFSLTREGGVTALAGDETTNLIKGAYFTDEADFDFYFESSKGIHGYENIYIDFEKSTSEKMYCYAYILWQEALEEDDMPQMILRKYPASRQELRNMDANETQAEGEKIQEDAVVLTDKGQVPIGSIDLGDDGYLEYSPICISIDMSKGMGLSEEEAQDPVSMKHLEIQYKDGSRYVISDTENNVENSSYSMAAGTWYKTVLNRLVDVDDIEKIIVNQTSFPVS